MKLVTHGPDGSERPGIVDAARGIRDLSGKCQDFGPAFFAANDTAALRDVDVETLPKVKAGSRIGTLRGTARQFHRDRAQLRAARPRDQIRRAEPQPVAGG